MTKIVTLLFLVPFLSPNLYGYNFFRIKILPGCGIIYKNDSILLQRSTFTNTCRVLKINENQQNEVEVTLSQGVETVNGKSVDWSEYTRVVKFRNLILRFDDNKPNKLLSIIIRPDEKTKILTEKDIEIEIINPKIKDLYPNLQHEDFISSDSLNYYLKSYGISFQLEKITNNNFQLIEISIETRNKNGL